MTPDSQWMPIGAFASYPRWHAAVCEHLVKAGMPDMLVSIANYDEGKSMGLAPLDDASRFIDAARRTAHDDERDGQIRIDTTS